MNVQDDAQAFSAEESDAKKLERLDIALKASNEGIWDWFPNQPHIYYTRRVLEFLECSAANAPNIFLPPHDSVHPDDLPRFQAALAEAMSLGGPDRLSVDARLLTGSNRWIWLRIRGAVLRDRDGTPMRIAGSMIDISRRKAAEAQVLEERHILRTLIDHVPLQIYFKDQESRFVLCNRNVVERMGLAEHSDIVGKHDRDFFSEEHSRPAFEDELRIMQTREPMCDTLEHETWPDRDETWVITSKFPWIDQKGNVKGTFGVSNDVTKLVHAEQQAKALAKQLRKQNEIYEEELNLAREIQTAMTEHAVERVPGAVFAARYITSTGLAGDFYEIIHVAPGKAGVLICDVMGHGVRAALIVAMMRGLMEKQRSTAGDPGAFLTGLNDGLSAILERAGTTMFASAFYGVIDHQAGTFSYACAGHPGPLITTNDGSTSQIATQRPYKGPGLGLMSEVTYPTHILQLDSIMQAVLFTDGIFEAENPAGEAIGIEGLAAVIRTNTDPGTSIDQVLQSILKSVQLHSGKEQFDDDICLLGLRFIHP